VRRVEPGLLGNLLSKLAGVVKAGVGMVAPHLGGEHFLKLGLGRRLVGEVVHGAALQCAKLEFRG
jgi:hypothetical protein